MGVEPQLTPYEGEVLPLNQVSLCHKIFVILLVLLLLLLLLLLFLNRLLCLSDGWVMADHLHLDVESGSPSSGVETAKGPSVINCRRVV